MADFLPSRSVLSVCFPGCVLTSGEAEQQRKSKEIDKCLSREKTYVKRLVKILLLGAGESGKSTFLKQMRIIHGQDFDQRAREEFRPTIYSNVIKGGVPGERGARGRGGRRAGGSGVGRRRGQGPGRRRRAPPSSPEPPAGRAGRGRGRGRGWRGAAPGPPPRRWPRPPPEGSAPGCRLASSPDAPAHPAPVLCSPSLAPRVAGGPVTWGRGYSQLRGRGAPEPCARDSGQGRRVTGSWPFGGKDVKLEGVPFAVLPSGKRTMPSV